MKMRSQKPGKFTFSYLPNGCEMCRINAYLENRKPLPDKMVVRYDRVLKAWVIAVRGSELGNSHSVYGYWATNKHKVNP